MFRELTEAENERLMLELAGIKVKPTPPEKLKSPAEGELLEDIQEKEAELEMMSYRLAGIKTDGR